MAKNKDSFVGNSEAKFEETLSKLESWYNKNNKMLSTVLVVILVLVGGFFAYKYMYQAPRENDANNNIFHAQRMFELDSLDIALNGNGMNYGFLTVVDEYGGTNAANLSKYYIGAIYMKQGNFEDAITYLEDFSPKGDLFLYPMSKSLLGDAYAELNDFDMALSSYDKAINFGKNDVIIPDVLLKAAAICDINGNLKQALSYYETLRKDYIRSQQAQNADKFIAMIKTKLGE